VRLMFFSVLDFSYGRIYWFTFDVYNKKSLKQRKT